MSTTVTFLGVSYTLPSPGDTDDWGAQLTAFLTALAAAQPTTVFAATSTGAGQSAVTGSASGSGGVGVTGSSSAGYGLVASGDTTTPAMAAFRIIPQNTQPAGVPLPNAVGDIYVTTAGVLKICTVAGAPGTWVSVGTQT